jgi:hypothetical protein
VAVRGNEMVRCHARIAARSDRQVRIASRNGAGYIGSAPRSQAPLPTVAVVLQLNDLDVFRIDVVANPAGETAGGQK